MEIEKIKFERTGGFAGIRLAAEIELDDLPEDERRELLRLLDELDFEELPEKLARHAPVPDEFSYTISVIAKDKKEYTVSAGDTALPADMRPLLEMLEGIAKRQMRKHKQDD
ncbi:MAG: protealysin inhibitor emfourin [Chloroflexota bacterium]